MKKLIDEHTMTQEEFDKLNPRVPEKKKDGSLAEPLI
jgi:hypothetical protein